ncbi:MAG: hypothetical protein JW910_07900 [Anaerolineae bacterium]|nr:hypothetical protein [Anaerolineae bacterium]
MKRLVCIALLLALVLGALPAAVAQEGPDGVWLGTWPYRLPPDHHLNAYASGGPLDNLGNVYREFVELAPAYYMWADDTYVGFLAESWGFVEDNTAYEIVLRSDAMWSNGTPVTADDVITTYALGKLVGWSQFNYIDEVERVDDHTVRFHFINEPSRVAERLLLREPIAANDTYGEWAQQALELFATGVDNESEEWQALLTAVREFRPEEYLATGPYTYSLADVGDSFLTLHWQPNSIFSDSVQFGTLKLWAGETESTTPLVLSGEIAHATNVYPPATIETFQTEGINIVTIPRGYGPALLFNCAIWPWNITEVRQAVAMVIERDQNAFLTNGFGATGTVYMAGVLDSSVQTMLTEEAIAQLDLYEYDTDRAAALLESIGFARNDAGIWADADGNTLSAEWVFPAEFADFAGATQDAISQMNDFGFDITARALPWQEVPTEIRNGTFELSVWSWGAASPFSSQHLRNPMQRWITELGVDEPGLGFPMEAVEYNGETINLDEMISNASSGLDTQVQRERTSEVALILNELMPYVPLNIILSAEPLNTNLVSGVPEPGDPILLNPTGTDHFIKYLILTGVLGPAM